MKNFIKIFVFLIVFFLMAMSGNKTAKGKLVLTGNDPFSYFLLRGDDGQKLILKGDRTVLMPLQGRRVELTYSQTDEKRLHPIVKVIEIKEEK